MLYNCSHCKENSVVRKIYTMKNKYDVKIEKSLVEYCINKGCSYRRKLKTISNGESNG